MNLVYKFLLLALMTLGLQSSSFCPRAKDRPTGQSRRAFNKAAFEDREAQRRIKLLTGDVDARIQYVNEYMRFVRQTDVEKAATFLWNCSFEDLELEDKSRIIAAVYEDSIREQMLPKKAHTQHFFFKSNKERALWRSYVNDFIIETLLINPIKRKFRSIESLAAPIKNHFSTIIKATL